MAMGTRTVKASELLTEPVRNAHGENLGHVDDVLIDPATGRVVWVKVQVAGDSEAANSVSQGSCIEIPWSQFSQQKDYLRLNVSKQVLRNETERRMGG